MIVHVYDVHDILGKKQIIKQYDLISGKVYTENKWKRCI